MPYISQKTTERRTWRERLFTWPWRPWVSTRTKTEWVFVHTIDERAAEYRTLRVARRPPQVVKAYTPRGLDDRLQRQFADEPSNQSRFSYVSSDDIGAIPVQPAAWDEPNFVSGGGGDFGGGGATSSWDDATPSTSCDSSNTSDYSPSSSQDTSSCSDSSSSSSSDWS